MKLAKRKEKIAHCEKHLKASQRRLAIAMGVVSRWRKKLYLQQRALVKELEAELGERRAAGQGRKFLDEE